MNVLVLRYYKTDPSFGGRLEDIPPPYYFEGLRIPPGINNM